MEKHDSQLIAEYLEGDESALETLVDRYLKDVYHFVTSLVGDRQAAEDIAQEAFVKAWKNIRKFRLGSDFHSWLFTIARNSAIDWLRTRKAQAFSSFENAEGRNMLLESLVDEAPRADELLARAEDARYAADLLEELHPRYREVLILRNSGNLTFEEIGKALGRPLHTVKSQYRRALTSLRRAFEARSA